MPSYRSELILIEDPIGFFKSSYLAKKVFAAVDDVRTAIINADRISSITFATSR